MYVHTHANIYIYICIFICTYMHRHRCRYGYIDMDVDKDIFVDIDTHKEYHRSLPRLLATLKRKEKSRRPWPASLRCSFASPSLQSLGLQTAKLEARPRVSGACPVIWHKGARQAETQS